MNYEERWEKIDDIGEGGQGKVIKVIPKSLGYFSVDLQIIEAIKRISHPNNDDTYRREQYPIFKNNLIKLFQREKPEYQKALKILHEPQDARDSELAEERIKREIKSMSECNHPNIVNVIDHDLESMWYVSNYYVNGSLAYNKEYFKGNILISIKKFRGLVEGVEYLHNRKLVHRDIKPENVFLDDNNNLILGDFGLVYFDDDNKTRISKKYENVCSRDWMPGWAYGMLIEDIKPSFDVFALGKILWSMISGKTILPLWYFDRDQFNIENMFPDDKDTRLINNLFKKCIVENEGDCLQDANTLLAELDEVIYKLEKNVDLLDPDIKRKCKVCGIGDYRLEVDEDITDTRNFGITVVAGRRWKIFTCSYCGHVQLFSFNKNNKPPAWR